MDIEFDTIKEAANIAKHRMSLNDAMLLLEGRYAAREDGRVLHERRMIATGEIGGRVHVCVYTMRGDVYWIISLRKANRREIDAYRQS